jgi:hypothetical protein
MDAFGSSDTFIETLVSEITDKGGSIQHLLLGLFLLHLN